MASNTTQILSIVNPTDLILRLGVCELGLGLSKLLVHLSEPGAGILGPVSRPGCCCSCRLRCWRACAGLLDLVQLGPGLDALLGSDVRRLLQQATKLSRSMRVEI